MSRKNAYLVALVFVLLLGAALVNAQDDESAWLRVDYVIWDGPLTADVYLDDQLLTEDLPRETASDLLEVEPGEHTVTIVPAGEGPEAALIEPINVTLEPGHGYVLLAHGPIQPEEVLTGVLDLGTIPDPGETAPTRLAVHNFLEGVSAIDLAVDDVTVVTDVPFGESVVVDMPVDAIHNTSIIDSETGNVLLFGGAPLEAGYPSLPLTEGAVHSFVALGKFPGEEGPDFRQIHVPAFLGPVTRQDAGEIAVGDSVEVELAAGERARYTLTLDEPASLNISLLGDPDSVLDDAVVRVFDADGNLIDENDELSHRDSQEGVFDAGLVGLELEPGTYTVEAATWLDIGPGTFTLAVENSAE